MSLHGSTSVQAAAASHPADTTASIGAAFRRWVAVSALMLSGALWASNLSAHDASTWGGLFRTQDGGATWRHLTPASFGAGAMAVAVSPADPHHLLLATDSGVSRSRNGGRDWGVEASDILTGPAFAATFDVDGERALVSGASAIFWTDGQSWRRIHAPAGSAPARALVSGSVRGRAYLAGRTGLYRSDDWGESWVDVADERQTESASALLVDPRHPDHVYAVAGGRLWASTDGGRSWQPRGEGLPPGSVEVAGLDPSDSNRLWAVGRGQVFQTGDQGQRWWPLGTPLPESPVAARGIAVSGHVVLVATDRGLYRSPDDGERWEIPSENLPAHLEAGLLVADPRNPTTFYAGFALTPYDELARRAVEGGRPFGRLDLTNLVGGMAIVALLVLSAVAVLRHLARTYYRRPLDRPVSPALDRPRRSGDVVR